MDTTYLTVKQLSEALKNNPYILVRYNSGRLIGLNAKVAPIVKKKKKKKKYKPSQETAFVGFIPCSFDAYISHKVKFI